MDTIGKIRRPVGDDFGLYEKYMKEAMKSDSGYVKTIVDYIIANRGKGIRPMLVFLMSGVHGSPGMSKERTYLAAMLVEMIHNASLIHDDVVDDASMRHGKPSVNSKWNSRVSVLMGDFILARGFSAGMSSREYDVVAYVTAGIADLAEGELIQDDINDRRAMTRQSYYEIIFKKTAMLLGISCGAGALAMKVSAAEVEKARQIGLDLGMAFQIKDDILDYSPGEQTGKPFCADLREKKITLPLLSVIEQGGDAVRKFVTDRLSHVEIDPEAITDICNLVAERNGIASAEAEMFRFLDHARTELSAYPESPYRESLLLLCDYIGSRDK